MAQLVLLIVPTFLFSIIKFSLLTNLLSIDVFVLIFSTKASCEPRITTSFLGVLILLFSYPLTSHTKHVFIVSINKAQFPVFTDDIISSKFLNHYAELNKNRYNLPSQIL